MLTMKKYSVVFVLSLLLVVNLTWAQDNYIYKQISSLPYHGTDNADAYTKEMCVLDFYYPTNRKNFATVVWFHGGGLVSGKREIPDFLKQQGFAVIGVGYRLSPKVKAVQCIRDAAKATAWAFDTIEKYGGDPSLIFVAGMSAGGYITYMLGLDKSYLQVYNIDANQIAGLIPFSGHAITHFTVRKEMGIAGTQPRIDNMAPLFHLRADAPPLVIITGDREREMLGRYEENAYLARMMKVIGHKNTQLYELGGYNHPQMMYAALPILCREVKKMMKVKLEIR